MPSELVSDRTRPLLASVTIGLAVSAFLVWLTYARDTGSLTPSWAGDLSHVAAAANASTALALLGGLFAIRRRRIDLHRRFMTAAVGFSAVFFGSYVLRHYFVGDTPFSGAPSIRPIYLTILVTHILGSMIVLALLPMHLYLAATKQWLTHRRLGRWLLPIWLWVSASGVVVYLMLHSWT